MNAATPPAGTPPADTRRARYLARALQINPLERPDELVRLRSRFLGLQEPAGAKQNAEAGGNLQERRDRAAQIIDRVRQQFWKLDLNGLRRGLAGLELQDFPELEHAATRLSVTAANRHLLPKLAQHKHFDSELFSALKAVLVCSPRDVTGIKEDVRRSLKDRQRHKQIARMAQLLKRQTPELYELERDWLDSIVRYRPGKQKKETYAEFESDDESSFAFSGWMVWIVVVVILRVVRRMMAD